MVKDEPLEQVIQGSLPGPANLKSLHILVRLVRSMG